jgi:hypothetical protein
MKHLRSLAVFALIAAPVAAQQPGMMGRGMMPQMMQMQEMMAPMRRGMAFAPNHLLARKDSLGLTAQQVARLTTLRDAAKAGHDAAHAEAKAHMDGLAQAFHASAPDTSAVKLHFQAAHAAMGKAHWTMLAAAAQAKALLTDEQRVRVDRWASTMMEHH